MGHSNDATSGDAMHNKSVTTLFEQWPFLFARAVVRHSMSTLVLQMFVRVKKLSGVLEELTKPAVQYSLELQPLR